MADVEDRSDVVKCVNCRWVFPIEPFCILDGTCNYQSTNDMTGEGQLSLF